MSDEKKTGRVYLASKNARGKWAGRPAGSVTVDATSLQSKNSINRRDLSPMSPFVTYNEFYCFENYWQSLRVYEHLADKRPQFIAWWQALKRPKRRYPGTKGKKVLYASRPGVEEKLTYVESRKKIYVPEYYEMVKNREAITTARNQLKSGRDICVVDIDGPRADDGTPLCHEITLDYLKEKIDDEKFPFGHGYIVASLIAGIDYKNYV